MSSNWLPILVEAGLRARNPERFNDDALLPVARAMRTGEAVDSSNLLAALGLACWDAMVLEGLFESYALLGPLRPLTYWAHFAAANIYSQGRFLRSVFRYASRDSADDEEGLVLSVHVLWMLVYMGVALLCHNIAVSARFLWCVVAPILPFLVPVLLFACSWHYLGGQPAKYVQLSLFRLYDIAYFLMGYTVFASKIVTKAVFVSLYNVWDGLFFRKRIHQNDLPTYIYEPFWNNRCIRLLNLSRRFPFGPITYKLSAYALDARPSYEAISYTWGDPSLHEFIIVDGCKLHVTPNVLGILQDRATFWKDRTIWIDSVCIDQTNREEKSVQIPLMREVYSRASRVLVWLGSQPDSRIAMGFLVNINRRIRFEGLRGADLKTMLEIGSKSPKWPALFTLLNHPYWTRSWIIQEIAAGNTVHIYYGGAILTWEYFASTIEMLHTQDVGTLLIVSHTAAVPRAMPHRGAGCIMLISLIRSTIRRQSCMELGELLLLSDKSDATEAKDKIFAILGMADLTAQSALAGLYSKRLEEIYLSTTRFLLSQPEHSRVLHRAGVGRHRRTAGLPSWCVDWNCPFGSRSFWKPSKEVPYRASGASLLQLNVHRSLPVLEIGGQLIDEIELCGRMCGDLAMDETADLVENAGVRMLALQDATSIAHSPSGSTTAYFNGQSRDEALWRTLIGDRDGDIWPAPAQCKASYEAAMRILAGARGPILGNDVPDQTLKKLYPGTPTEKLPARIREDDILARKFYKGIGGGLHQRKFAVSTRKGYFMLVPELARPGDCVCLFWGVQTPFLVRRLEGADGLGGSDNRYELVGECYVHGIMDGEAVSGEDYQTFVLV